MMYEEVHYRDANVMNCLFTHDRFLRIDSRKRSESS